MSETAATAQLRDADAAARAQAQTVFDRPIVIEAGAGTGKTQTLVSRIVAWSVGPGWERVQATTTESDLIAARVLRGVVAITFTEAAAAEMNTRLAEVLAALERGEQPAGILPAALDRAGTAVRERARALLSALDHVVIRTIHAYCRRLLGRYPIEAAVHPNLTVDADGSRQAEVVRGVVEAAMRRGYSTADDALLLDLAEHNCGPLQVEEAVNALIAEGTPPDVLAADPYTPARIAAAVGELCAACDALDTALGGRTHRLPAKSIASRIAAALSLTAERVRGHAIATLAQLERLSAVLEDAWLPPALERLREWGRGDIGAKEQEAFGDRCAAIAAAAGPLALLIGQWRNLNPGLLDLARRAIAPLLAEAYHQLHISGIATYSALLHGVHGMLQRHPETAAAIRREIDQLLVDEMQDTDVVQCAIVRTLALSGPIAERPALFLVGDPKQSIYGWRSADLRAYDDFVASVIADGGVQHVLSVNYRSRPAILTEVGRAVAPIMRRSEGLQPAFQPLIPAPARNGDASDDTRPAVEYWIAAHWDADARQPATGGRAADVNALEARALANDLRRVHDHDGVAWRDIGILFRSSTDLDTYLGALRAAGVPYVVEGDRQYYERREVIDAAALLRTILEPHDQLALLTVLRSPLIGVPDAALLPLWSRGFPDAVTGLSDMSPAPLQAVADLVAAAAADLPNDVDGLDALRGWEHNLIRAVHAVAALRASFATEAVDIFVERLRAQFLPEAIEASRRLGAYRLANLQRFFRQLLAALEQGESDPQQLLRRIRTAIAERADAEEERPSDADNAVRVLTIHRAKGLDFAHVYVMQLHKEAGTTWGNPVDMAAQGERSEYRLFTGRTLGFWNVEARRTAVAAAEQVRTLYVAMTRAKTRLVLSGRWPSKQLPIAPEQARSQVSLLLSRQPSPPNLNALMLAASTSAGMHVDDEGVRWAFPALIPSVTGDTGAHTAFTQDTAAIRFANQRLGVLSEAAARHNQRPLVCAVSAIAADLLDDDPTATLPEARGTQRDARVARASGIAVHAVLENWTPAHDPHQVFRVQEARLRNLLRAYATSDEVDDALSAARSLLERVHAGTCGARLRAIASGIVARELPVLIPPSETDDAGPTGCITGAIDLIYRDPDTAEIVVADYKTDHVESADHIAAHVDAYREQGAQYVRAVHEALQLARPPRFELWFLHPGRIEVVIP